MADEITSEDVIEALKEGFDLSETINHVRRQCATTGILNVLKIGSDPTLTPEVAGEICEWALRHEVAAERVDNVYADIKTFSELFPDALDNVLDNAQLQDNIHAMTSQSNAGGGEPMALSYTYGGEEYTVPVTRWMAVDAGYVEAMQDPESVTPNAHVLAKPENLDLRDAIRDSCVQNGNVVINGQEVPARICSDVGKSIALSDNLVSSLIPMTTPKELAQEQQPANVR